MCEKIRIILPDQYDLVVGDTFQLFYRGVIEAPNPYFYDILAVCDKGRNYSRYFEYTPEEAGKHTLTISVYASDKTLLGEASTLLNVCTVGKSPEIKQNILCVGDSLTAGGVWVYEVFRRLTAECGEPKGNALSNFHFIGTCEKNGVCFEGYGGWTWDSYITRGHIVHSAVWFDCKHNKTERDQHSIWMDEDGNLWQLETIEQEKLKFNRYRDNISPKPDCGMLKHYQNAQNTEPILFKESSYTKSNPFWDDDIEDVDFSKYCEKNGFDGIDAVYTLLTWNGIDTTNKPHAEDHADTIAKAKRFVDRLHEQYPKAKVKIMGLQIPSVTGGTGASYGACLPYCDDYGLTRFVFGLNLAYQQWVNEEQYRDFVEFIQISGQFDSEYNMPSAEKPVNTRSKIKEIIGINGVHPTEEGYLQIADAAYRNMIKTFTYEP